MKKILLLVVLFWSTSAVSSDAFERTQYLDYDKAIGILHNVQILVADDVTDRCWTNVTAVENRIKAKLEQAGIRTYNEALAFDNGFTARLHVTANGYKATETLCVGTLTYRVINTVSQSFGNWDTVGATWTVDYPGIMFDRGSLFSSSTNLNDQFLSTVDSYTDDLIASVFSGRRDAKVSDLVDTMTNLTQEPMTNEEFEELFSEYLERQ